MSKIDWTVGAGAFEAFIKSIEDAKKSMIDISEGSFDSESAEYVDEAAEIIHSFGNTTIDAGSYSSQAYYAPQPYPAGQLYKMTPPVTAGMAAGTCSVCDTYHNKLWWDGTKIISECCGQKNFVDILVEDNGKD